MASRVHESRKGAVRDLKTVKKKTAQVDPSLRMFIG
jgi:hypothetical protein